MDVTRDAIDVSDDVRLAVARNGLRFLPDLLRREPGARTLEIDDDVGHGFEPTAMKVRPGRTLVNLAIPMGEKS